MQTGANANETYGY